MSYIGNNLQVAYPSYRVIDDISSGFNGVLKTFALRVAGSTPIPFPINPQQCLLSVNNIVQKPDSTGASGFTLTGSNIVFATAPTAGWSFFGTVLAGADYVNVGANFPSGTAAVPSVTFDGSTGTGLFLASSNVLGIATSGVQQMTVDSSGNVSVTGGIASALGTAVAPAYRFTGDPNTGIYSPGADTLAFVEGGVEVMRIDSSGRVGIGTSSPGYKIDVQGGNYGFDVFGANNGANYLTLRSGYAPSGTGGIGFQCYQGDTGNYDALALYGYGGFRFNVNGSERARIDSSGRLLVGQSTNPDGYYFIVNTGSGSNNNAVQLSNNANADLRINLTSGVSLINANTGILALGTSGTERARIDSNGRLLVGTSTAATTDNNANSPNIQLEGADGNASRLLVRSNAGTTATAGPIIYLSRSRGTTANSKTSVAADDLLGSFVFEGTDGTADRRAASISAFVDVTPDASDMPGRLVFSTTPDNTFIPTEAVRITSNQDLMLSQAGSGIFVGTTVDGDFRIGQGSYAASTGTLYIGNAAIQVSSDVRLKDNIEDTSLDALEAISKIKVKDYTWNDPSDTCYNNRNARGKWTGLIAQELVEVLPFVVNAPRKETDGSIDHKSQSTWTLDQSQLCPVLIKAVQQQQEIISSLEARITALEAE